MNDDFDDLEEKQSGSSWIPTALAILALVLGGAALFFALDASRRLAPMSDSLAEGVSGVAGLEDRIDRLEEQIVELAEAGEALKGRVQRSAAYSSQNEKMIRKLVEEINANRERIIKSAEALAGRGPQPSGGSSSATNDAGTSSGATPTAGEGGNYTIQPGDTFAKIAEQSGVSLQALLDANPGVDPRRLRIGQSIVLPSN
ncbi:MAG: LysM peptidoglycan-binding domain-containing protein [Coraliomargaritaceae bacterium]